MMEGFRQFRKELSDKDDTYPQHGRFNVIIDRRDCYTKSNDTDELIIFDPPNDCNTIPHQHLAEKYFDLSRMCLIPKSDYKSLDEVKCYLYWQGQGHRFYPNDIKKVLPNIFNMNQENKAFIKSKEAKELINRMKISDKKFEKFYRGLNGLHQAQPM